MSQKEKVGLTHLLCLRNDQIINPAPNLLLVGLIPLPEGLQGACILEPWTPPPLFSMALVADPAQKSLEKP